MRKMYYFKVGDIVETLSKSSKGLIIRVESGAIHVKWLDSPPFHSEQEVSLYGVEYVDKFLKPVVEV